jgi:hypothetical protein
VVLEAIELARIALKNLAVVSGLSNDLAIQLFDSPSCSPEIRLRRPAGARADAMECGWRRLAIERARRMNPLPNPAVPRSAW